MSGGSILEQCFQMPAVCSSSIFFSCCLRKTCRVLCWDLQRRSQRYSSAICSAQILEIMFWQASWSFFKIAGVTTYFTAFFGSSFIDRWCERAGSLNLNERFLDISLSRSGSVSAKAANCSTLVALIAWFDLYEAYMELKKQSFAYSFIFHMSLPSSLLSHTPLVIDKIAFNSVCHFIGDLSVLVIR